MQVPGAKPLSNWTATQAGSARHLKNIRITRASWSLRRLRLAFFASCWYMQNHTNMKEKCRQLSHLRTQWLSDFAASVCPCIPLTVTPTSSALYATPEVTEAAEPVKMVSPGCKYPGRSRKCWGPQGLNPRSTREHLEKFRCTCTPKFQFQGLQ